MRHFTGRQNLDRGLQTALVCTIIDVRANPASGQGPERGYKDNPANVLARSYEPFMEPLMSYEQKGFYGNCVFTNGHTYRDGIITLYYGASDTVVCGATIVIEDLLRFTLQ